MIAPFHDYQLEAVRFQLVRLKFDECKGAGLFLDPGLGKTRITLELIRQLRQWGDARRVLIVAPLRVIYSVWPAEVKKWGYPYRTSIIHGPGSKKRNALAKQADVFLINPEGIAWLAKQYKLNFDLLVVDESTKFKNWSAVRTKALRSILPKFKQRVILTGTPSPNSYTDLHSQIFICDDGEALGKTLTVFRERYCCGGAGFEGRGFEVTARGRGEIERAISPIVLRMSCEDHLDMPARVEHEIEVELPPAIRDVYRDVEEKLFSLLDSGEELAASSAGAAYSLCRQIANGGAYQTDEWTGERSEIYVHSAKVDAAVDLVEELGGKPVLIAYQFQHDAARLLKAFPGAPIIRGGGKPAETATTIDRWNEGRIPVLLVQPQALSHGANMQHGGRDLVWFGHTDQLEIFLQLNARLWRQGQTQQVRFHHLIARDTVDEAVLDRLRSKDKRQTALLEALKQYRLTKGNTCQTSANH